MEKFLDLEAMVDMLDQHLGLLESTVARLETRLDRLTRAVTNIQTLMARDELTAENRR